MNWSTRWSFIAVVAMGLFGLGCSGASQVGNAERAVASVDEAMVEGIALSGDSVSPNVNAAIESTMAEASESVTLPAERLIIRNGSLTIVAEDTELAMASIRNMADDMAGWITVSEVSTYAAGAQHGEMSIRVPSASFNAALQGIKSVAVEVLNESISGQDVTEEYVDLSARLTNLQATTDRVRSFLEEAKTVEEALEVNRELSRLEGELESVQGRLQYLSESAAYSSISVNIRPNAVPQISDTLLWQPLEVVKEARDALLWTLQGLGTMVIWIGVYFLPAALIFALPVWFAWRWLRKRSRAWAGSV